MPIVAVCGQCSKRYTLDDKFAGRKVKCRTCNSSFVVPAEEPTLVNAPEPEPEPEPDPPAPDPTATLGEDILELRTEFKERGQMATISEDKPEGGETRTLGKRGTRGTERKKRSRYRKKSHWKLKTFVGLIVILGLLIGAGMIFAPKNMARKWQVTKEFWGTSFTGYLKEMVSIDMALEKGDATETPEETPEEPAGPPAGSDVIVRGTVVAVSPGVAGKDPTTFTVKTGEGAEYRGVLSEPSERLAAIAKSLEDEEDGPTVTLTGKLAKNTATGEMTQVEVSGMDEEAEIGGKPGFEVVGGAKKDDEAGGSDEAEEPDDSEESEEPQDGSGDESGGDAGDDG